MDKVLFGLVIVTIFFNMLLGVWRTKVPKFSWQWFVALHSCVPLIYLLRVKAGLHLTAVPVLITAAILGQKAGAAMLEKNIILLQKTRI